MRDLSHQDNGSSAVDLTVLGLSLLLLLELMVCTSLSGLSPLLAVMSVVSVEFPDIVEITASKSEVSASFTGMLLFLVESMELVVHSGPVVLALLVGVSLCLSLLFSFPFLFLLLLVFLVVGGVSPREDRPYAYVYLWCLEYLC